MKSRLLVLLLVALGLLAAGCGGGSASSDADPAKLAPAGAPVYFEAAVRPDGDLEEDARAALEKLLQTDDPGAEVTGLIDRLGKDQGIAWADFEPWLGERVGVFLSAVSEDSATGAGIIAVKDADEARESIRETFGRESKFEKRDYKGTEFSYAAEDDAAVGIVDGFAVVGTWAGVRQVVDTAEGGQPISEAEDFAAARDAVEADDDLGFAFVQVEALADLLESGLSQLPGNSAQALAGFRQLLADAGRAAAVALHADAGTVRFDTATLGAPASSTAGYEDAAERLAQLPGDAWLAAAFGDVGASVTKTLDQLDQLKSGPFGAGIDDTFGWLEDFAGIDLREDLLSWMGQGAVYARGTGLADLGAVVTIESKDEEKSRRAVDLIGGALRDLGAAVGPDTVEGYDEAIAVELSGAPFPLLIAAGGDRFSIGVNRQALTDVLEPSSTLGDSPQYEAAGEALGEGIRPVFLLDTPTVVGIVQTFAGSRPEVERAEPYLEVLGPLAAGAQREDDVAKFALALGLR